MGSPCSFYSILSERNVTTLVYHNKLLHRRRKKSSTIFCSQYEFEEWYDQLGGDDSPLADAIIDRIAHDSYRINITSIDAEHDISMREVYGLDKTLRE